MAVQSCNLNRRMDIVPKVRLGVQELADTRDGCLQGKKASQRTAHS